jgi:hypothetical protein
MSSSVSFSTERARAAARPSFVDARRTEIHSSSEKAGGRTALHEESVSPCSFEPDEIASLQREQELQQLLKVRYGDACKLDGVRGVFRRRSE